MKRLLIAVSLILIVSIIAVFGILLSKNKRALLSVESIPETEVRIDGKVFGSTPSEFELKPGVYEVELVHYLDGNNRISYRTSVELEPRVKTILKRTLSQNSWQESGELLTLRPVAGNHASITVVTTPPTATVVVDDKSYRAPVTVSRVSPGNHILLVNAANFVQYESVIKAQAGFDVTAFIDLAQKAEVKEPQVRLESEE